jgi:hypothetical protein
MTGAESWDRRRDGASRSSGRINLIERDKSMGGKVRAEIFHSTNVVIQNLLTQLLRKYRQTASSKYL